MTEKMPCSISDGPQLPEDVETFAPDEYINDEPEDRGPQEALRKDGKEGWDYILNDDVDCVWIRINNIAVYLRRQDEGVAVSLYPNGHELDDELAGTWALYTEAESDEDYCTPDTE